jgi:hypothetical protein
VFSFFILLTTGLLYDTIKVNNTRRRRIFQRQKDYTLFEGAWTRVGVVMRAAPEPGKEE